MRLDRKIRLLPYEKTLKESGLYAILVRGDRMEKKRERTQRQIDYMKDYNNRHVKWRKVSFNDKNPDDMILMNWIDSQEESTSAYIKHLIREDMEKQSIDPV